VGRPEMHIGTMVVWSPGVGLGVWQAWRASQDVVCPPGPLCGVVVSPPGVRAALVQLHHWGLQDGHFIVLREGTHACGQGSGPGSSATWGTSFLCSPSCSWASGRSAGGCTQALGARQGVQAGIGWGTLTDHDARIGGTALSSGTHAQKPRSSLTCPPHSWLLATAFRPRRQASARLSSKVFALLFLREVTLTLNSAPCCPSPPALAFPYRFIHTSPPHSGTHLPVYPPIHLSIHPFTCPPVHSPTCSFIHPLPIHAPIHSPVCLAIYLSSHPVCRPSVRSLLLHTPFLQQGPSQVTHTQVQMFIQKHAVPVLLHPPSLQASNSCAKGNAPYRSTWERCPGLQLEGKVGITPAPLARVPHHLSPFLTQPFPRNRGPGRQDQAAPQCLCKVHCGNRSGLLPTLSPLPSWMEGMTIKAGREQKFSSTVAPPSGTSSQGSSALL
jgi:hypothetical protein